MSTNKLPSTKKNPERFGLISTNSSHFNGLLWILPRNVFQSRICLTHDNVKKSLQFMHYTSVVCEIRNDRRPSSNTDKGAPQIIKQLHNKASTVSSAKGQAIVVVISARKRFTLLHAVSCLMIKDSCSRFESGLHLPSQNLIVFSTSKLKTPNWRR